ncbi:hypothetical protein CsatB_007872 [Cannabis sativa]|uniref:Uncharacterized protein n=1 Tax=Cannabis sativa TaxID=3483 RepID=A0A803QUZ8_CANSA
MGACLSFSISSSESVHYYEDTNKANIISINGDLRQYPTPVIVAHVLDAEASSSSSSSSDLFICNSDALYFDQQIPAMELQEHLHPNQIYFVLHKSRTEQPLSASDMATLALKATQALDLNKNSSSSSSSTKRHRRRHRRRKYSRITHHDGTTTTSSDDEISKETTETAIQFDQDYYLTIAPSKKKMMTKEPLGISRTGSVRRLQRLTSKRAKMAVRSFRLKLTTIYEGTILI